MKRLILFFLLFSATAGSAQTGTLQIFGDERILLLPDLHRYIVRNQPNIQGFRIQIYSDSGPGSRDRAEREMYRFMAEYPEHRAYVSFKQPNFRVLVGDFHSEAEAEPVVHFLRQRYERVFIVPDIINTVLTDEL